MGYNKFHSSMYNKTSSIRDISKSIDNNNNIHMQNYYSLCPSYNVQNNRINNNKQHMFKNNIPVTFFPSSGYNIDPTYFNQVPYQNCTEYINNEYYWNYANYYNWNNVLLHNENMYSSKKIEYPPYYLCNGQYTTQSKFFTPLCICTFTPLRLCAFAPLRHYAFVHLHFYAFTPLHLYAFTPLRLYAFTPLHHYTITPLYTIRDIILNGED
ncbi:nucleic acid binding factor [Plasmodium ovale wallikeri]|uniref:Nucleic acid binding factor n=1 Tax=Plasmodium ovale wallikeri TaxID=864142 RepID=A0A1A8YTS1_PLAOA|nr:nucleic acid binding factor [Plasmodium ovale wallikeri]